MRQYSLVGLLLLVLTLPGTLSADPVSLTVSPAFQVAFTGSTVTVQVAVSGLQAESIGAFQLTLNYDPQVLTLQNVTFGHPVFGDQLNLSGFGTSTLVDLSTPGQLTLAEVSFDSASTLNAAQDDDFVLVTVNFLVITTGTSPLSVSGITLGNAFGGMLPASATAGSLTAVQSQGGPPGTQTCVSTSSPAMVRSEGTAELLGNILLNCGPGVTANPITVSVSIQPSTVKIAPASTSPDNISTFPMPRVTTSVPVSGTPVGGLTVTVIGSTVNLTFTPVPGAQTFTISGIRANMAASGLAEGASISALLFTAGPLTISSSNLIVASAQTALGRNSGFVNPLRAFLSCAPPAETPSGAPPTIGFNPVSAADALQVSLIEGFPHAWRTAAEEDNGAGGVNGTRFRITLTGIPTGFAIYAPAVLSSGSATVAPAGTTLALTRVINVNEDGSGGSLTANTLGTFENVAITAGSATLVYEVTASNPGNTANSITFPVAFTGTTPTGVGTVAGSVSMAPVGPPTSAPARPQFAAGLVREIFNISLCASYVLFPTVVGNSDYDTGITVSNTTMDPLGTAPQRGDVTLYFWSADGRTQPAPVRISPAGGLRAGQTATFQASQLGVPFNGYVIAVCNFQFGHGLARLNSARLGAGMTYVGVVLTSPRLPDPSAPPPVVERTGR